MNEITQIRKLSLWIFFLPLIAINLCLLISQNPLILDNTIFKVDMIGRSAFTIPYFDGSLSISRASRTYPQYLIFKPAMIITAFFLYFLFKNSSLLAINSASSKEPVNGFSCLHSMNSSVVICSKLIFSNLHTPICF